MRRVAVLLGLLGMVLGNAEQAQACFCICVPYQPLEVWEDHIQVEIRELVCRKTIRVVFHNPNSQMVRGATIYMELEPKARVDQVQVRLDNQSLQAQVLPAQEAQKLLEDALRRGASPALLESYGKNLIRIRVPRVAPKQKVQLELSYTMTLESRGELVRLVLPNSKPKGLTAPVRYASVEVKLHSSRGIKNVYSPTHPIELHYPDDADLAVRWQGRNWVPEHQFVLYFQRDPDPVGASLLAYRDLDQQGYFLLMLSPSFGPQGKKLLQQVLPKDIVFCVDTSGSMLQQGKLKQAREALRYCLGQLRPQDRFGIVQFNTRVRVFRPQLLPATPENVQAALHYVENLHARGGTAMADALLKCLHLLGQNAQGRVPMIFFLTDGYPTLGIRDTNRLLEEVKKANRAQVRIFVFGQGLDVHARLLDLLAWQNQGMAEYVLPGENLVAKIRNYFDQVGSPLWTDLKVEFPPKARVSEVFPRRLPDLYWGQQVIVVGRYEGAGPLTLTLRGRQGQKEQKLQFQVHLPEFTDDEQLGFVPRLWAAHKVDHLLTLLRSGNSDPKLKQELIALATAYGIITPYTSFVVQMPKAPRPGAAARFAEKQLSRQLSNEMWMPLELEERKEQIHRSRGQNAFRAQLQRSGSGWALGHWAQVATDSRKAVPSPSPPLQTTPVRHIGNRTFIFRNNQWEQSDYDQRQKLQVVQVGSEEFWRLLRSQPKLAPLLAQGNVVLRINKQWYQFVLPSQDK